MFLWALIETNTSEGTCGGKLPSGPYRLAGALPTLASWATLESFTAFIYIFIKTRGSVFSMELVGKRSFGVLTTTVPCNLKSQFCTERAALLLTVNSEWWIARQREECSRSPGSFPNAAWVMYSFASLAGPRSELSLQFSSVPVRKPKEIEKRHLRVGAAVGGGLGKEARKQWAYVSQSACESSPWGCKYCVGLRLMWSMSLRCDMADSICDCTDGLQLQARRKIFVCSSTFEY